jgi:hypothetical protein
MSTDPIDPRLEALRGRGFPFDFEGSEEPVTEALIGRDPGDHFLTVGHTGSASMYALWRPDPAGGFADAPVVYLDSEGDPQKVIAASLDDFLTVLPYDAGTLYDLIRGRTLGAEALEEALAAWRADEVDGVPLPTWWRETLHAGPAPDPAAVIARGAGADAAFRAWLEGR